jgi:carboxymethylenebutenolidase
MKADTTDRKTAADFPPPVLVLFDQYVHGLLPRRAFVERAARYCAGIAGAELALAQLAPNFAWAQQVRPDDTRIEAVRSAFPSPEGHGEVKGLLVRPRGATGPAGAVLVVHENRGLNPYIEDVARRVALEGWIAFAPDALAPLGGYPGDEEQARALFPKIEQPKARADFAAAATALRTLAGSNGRVGVVGFCYGGSIANHLATVLPWLAAAVPFYGGQPPAEAAARARAALQLHFAGQDERINAGWPAWEAALKAAGVRHEAHVYPGTQHGFHNDTTPRYDEAAARLAWQRTRDFFRQHLAP